MHYVYVCVWVCVHVWVKVKIRAWCWVFSSIARLLSPFPPPLLTPPPVLRQGFHSTWSSHTWVQWMADELHVCLSSMCACTCFLSVGPGVPNLGLHACVLGIILTVPFLPLWIQNMAYHTVTPLRNEANSVLLRGGSIPGSGKTAITQE